MRTVVNLDGLRMEPVRRLDAGEPFRRMRQAVMGPVVVKCVLHASPDSIRAGRTYTLDVISAEVDDQLGDMVPRQLQDLALGENRP